jgi:glycosyltransferase involved in cell wall biosynthesis
MFMGGYVARFISTACRKPMLHTEHASELAGESFHPTIHELQSARDVFGESDCIAFVSQASRERTLSRLHIRLSPKHIVIGNLIREDLFSFDGQGMKLRGACSRFIAIGNFVRVKGFDVLLKAWRRHVHRFPNCMLTLAGSGPEREALVELCKELKIENSVEFIGRLERREVREQLQIHDVLVSSSIVETFGMVVAEAIACGIPVVCTNSGGVNDFVNESNGILADANEISLADALNHMMTMYSSYDRKRMSRTILDQYGSEMFYSNLLEAYNRAISNYC